MSVPLRIAVAVALTAWIVAPGPAAARAAGAGADRRLGELAADAGAKPPVLRIGLEHQPRVTVSARGPYRVLDAATGRPVWRERFEGDLQVLVEGAPDGGVATVYRVQVGAFGSQAAAEEELQRLAKLAGAGAGGVVRHDPDRGNWRVRLGRAEDRQALAPLLDRLRQAGLQGLWIAEEPAQEFSGGRLRLVDARFDSHVVSGRLALVAGGPLVVDGRTYRGVIELRAGPYGTVRPINWIGLESYLRGVVPAELGPEVWPRIEALRAQAVAARTYVWRNRGQFEDEGFDLCATPRCQVYAGAGAEHPLSDRAVASTAGEILVWNDRPIVALYTATCGGHTEDGAAIFPEHDEPYLRGVPCRAEEAALATMRGTLRGRDVPALADETGRDVTREWMLAASAGIVDPGSGDPQAWSRPAAAGEVRDWSRALCRLAGLPEPQEPAGDVSTVGAAAATLVADLGWTDRAEVLLAGEDVAALLRDPQAVRLPVARRRALALLAWLEMLGPHADGRFQVERAPSRALLLGALVRMAGRYEAFSLQEAVVAAVDGDRLRLLRGKGELRLGVAEQPWLLGLAGGRPVPAAELDLWPGDRIGYRLDAGGRAALVELRPPVKGLADDRSSRLYSWEVRRSRRELEAAVNRRVSVGTLRDLEIVRRGVSGRVVELEAVGDRGRARVRGFDVRRLLDLRESLLVIEPQRDAGGRLQAVVFAGKGWGHGVGLCQVGAYGMAVRGAGYREILSHYYSGARLTSLDPGAS